MKARAFHARPAAARFGYLVAMAVSLAACSGQTPVNKVEAAIAGHSAAADALFAQPYVDTDEWREAPVRHRYVHGGFNGTDTRFSFYFPEKGQYRGRFFQHITPVPDSENLAQAMPAGAYNKIGFAIASGAYFVETNGGGNPAPGAAAGIPPDSTITAYRANAAAARFSRTLAQQIYGGSRPFGYAYGGSGGAYRTVGSIENTQGVWDGVVPYVIGSTMAIPNMFTVRIQALRILNAKFPAIVDAMEPGGSGDPYAGLDPVESEVLREATKMGFPPQSWFGYKSMGIHGLAAVYGGVLSADPSYVGDFWSKPGYLGHDRPERFAGARLQFASKVVAALNTRQALALGLNINAGTEENRGGVDTAFQGNASLDSPDIVAYRLAAAPPALDVLGGDVIVRSGSARGKTMPLARIVGDIVVLGAADTAAAGQVALGDEIEMDNSSFLAMESYHRHQVPGPGFPVWDQFRAPDGTPAYPQRPMLVGPLFVASASGAQMTGKFDGKMIVVASLWDREAMPWQADWYRQRVNRNHGGNADATFRLWYTDRALHGDEPSQEQEDPTRIVSYQGMLQQALRDLSAWVERGVAPPASTSYSIRDGQVSVPASAPQRLGIQPVVTLTARGGERVDIKAGEEVRFNGEIEAPSGTGAIVEARWDFGGQGRFEEAVPVSPGARTASVTASHRFAKAGTYYVVLRAVSQRDGDGMTPYARIANLDRVRVVVQ